MHYEIENTVVPALFIHLSKDEMIYTLGSLMSWMSPAIEMLPEGSSKVSRVVSRIFGVEKESHINFKAKNDSGLLTFNTCLPGRIRPFQISDQNEMIIQRACFLCAESGVSLSEYYQKKMFYSGREGYVLCTASGNGVMFAALSGGYTEYELQKKQLIYVDCYHLAAMSPTCSIELLTSSTLTHAVSGGGNYDFFSIEGPGHIWLQNSSPGILSANVQSLLPGCVCQPVIKE